MSGLATRKWRSRRDLATGAARAMWNMGGLERSEGTLGTTLERIRKQRGLTFVRDWTFAELLQWAARRYGEDSFIETDSEHVSFDALNRRANTAARNLERLGVEAGDGVALMMGNHARFLEVFFAIQKLGAYAVPVNAGLIGDGLQYILDHSEVKLCVADHLSAPVIASVRQGTPRLETVIVSSVDAAEDFELPAGMLGYSELQQGEGDETANPVRTIDPEAPSLLLYTSGTTGLPKAVVTPFGNQRLKAMGLMANALYSRQDKLYTCLPLFHANCLLLTVMQAMWIGIPVYISKRFSASRFWQEVADSGATQFNTVGSMIPILLKTPPTQYDRAHRVKRVLSAACPKDAWEVFEQRFGVDIWEAYGAVDGGGTAIANLGTGPVGSLGKPRFRYRLVGDDGSDVGADQAGELWVHVGERKESRVPYFKNEKASNEKVRDGWLHTGDTMQRDGDGFLYFVGRNTDSMRRRGENVSAYEVEKQVDAHPDVLESAAFGVASDMGEEDIMICVVPIEGRSVDPASMLSFLRERLPRYALPSYMDVVDALPKTATHRVIKATLKQRGVSEDTLRL